MAYGQKYLFRWDSIYQVEFRIVILQDGYTGAVIQRPLGGAPTLKMQQNDCVKGTSLEWKAECRVDGEFAELYTSSPKEFAVELYRAGTKIWTGFITPELYSEPDIAPPYDVNIVATDGLGELKLYNYTKIGQQSIRSILQTILSHTGQDNEIYYVSQLRTATVTDIDFLRLIETDLDFEDGESCYDVLQSILTTLHATITLYRGKWLIVRETDFQVTGTAVRAIAAGTRAQSSETTLTDVVYSIGQMGVADMWPVGYSSTKIVPAKKRVIVEAPWHTVNGMVNADFSQGTSGWIIPTSPKGETSVLDTSIPAMLLGPTFTAQTGLPFGKFDPTSIVQEIDFSPLSEVMALEIKASGYYGGSTGKADRVLEVRILFTDLNDNVYYLEPGPGQSGLTWVATESEGRAISALLSSDTTQIESADTVSVNIPSFPYELSGTLRIEIYGQGAYVLGSSLTAALPKGYRDTINIQNGARGEDESVEIYVGKETADIRGLIPFLGGILIYNNAVISSFSDGNFSDLDFLALTSRGYALSVALPRLSTTGHFNMPASKTHAPLLLDHNGIIMAVQTYSWNLDEEELDLEALSLPAATLTVEDETVESMGDAEISQTGTSTSASGGSTEGAVKSIEVNGRPFTPNSAGKVTLPDYPTVPSDIATQTWVNNQGFITSVTSSMVTSALGFTPASQSGLNELGARISSLRSDFNALDETVTGTDGVLDRLDALEQGGGGGGGSVVSWGTQSTTSNTINLTVNGTTKTLVQKAGYDNLDDRVTALENGGGGSMQYLNFSKTATSAVVKEYNGSQEVNITAADLAAILGDTFATPQDLEDALAGYVTTDTDVQTILGFKKFAGGIGLTSGATASSGLRIRVVNGRIHIYGNVTIHGEVAMGDSGNTND